ncbi:MAG TPA: DUF6496 domain-containing protein [Polyangiaceae bacterium]|nr:DUF6496 domain-containing protein [Polyangiaceae bacterium]
MAKSKKYGAKAGKKVERAMREMKEGALRSGRSGKKVTSRKQAIAIGLSEARREGGKVPPAPSRARRTTKKSAARSTARPAKSTRSRAA